MDNKILAIVAVVIIAIVAVAAFVTLSGNGNQSTPDTPDTPSFEPVVVTDAIGNQVTVKNKVDRVALTELAHVELFATIYGEGWENHVCMMPEDISTRDASLGAYIEKTWPVLKNVPKCPDLYASLASNPTGVAEQILNTEPDLVILPGATMMWLTGIDSFYKLFSDSEVPVFISTFYTLGLTDSIVELNYGSLGKIFGTEDRTNEIVKMYQNSLKTVKDRLAGKSIDDTRIFYEVPYADVSNYGGVVNMGVPEVDILGYNVLKDLGVPMDNEYNLEKLVKADPDWIFLVDTSYYGMDQLTGYFMKEDTQKAQATLQKIIDARGGWADLDAVKDGHLVLLYGEFRFTFTDLFNLYLMASIIYDDVVSQKDIDDLMSGFSKYLPWKFEGFFSYQYEL